ncbi:MAG: succinylglutamate desuccinylase/aspartoacylase family protein [Pseudomonadota bacterium]|nr:succinylglutamate desuccinylase/aspartoacylase family protein [Pseudomonadota bacterium]
MTFANGLGCRLDLDAPGKRLGHLDLTHSDNVHAFDVIPAPIAVIAQGAGPTILLTAGNHGDEYEGQVILRRLWAETAAERVSGRIVLMPALNYPAMLADRRISPLDDGNLNRSFPGRADGGPTAAIADFVVRRLLPMAQAAIDFHSGGRQTEFVPSTFLCTHADATITRRSLELAEVFAAPYIYAIRGADSPAGMDPHAHDAGVAMFSTELSGGGGVNVKATDIGYRGLRRVLHHLGILEWRDDAPAPGASRLLDGVDGATTVMSPITGIFEPFHELGAQVQAGAPAGRVWALEEIDRPPEILPFQGDGVVAVRRAPARVVRGSFVYVVTPELSREALLRLRA